MNMAMIVICIIMALLSATGMWKANRGGVTALWILIGLMVYCLNELTVSYKALVILYGNQ